MGISLQVYRCRIGCFNTSLKAISSKSCKTTKSDRGPRKKIFLLVLFLLSTSCIAAALYAYNTSNNIPALTYPSPKSYNSQTLGPKQTHFQSQELKPWPPPFNSTLACSTPPPSASAWATTWQSSTSFQWAAVPVASRWRYIKCIGAWGVDPSSR